MILQYLMSEVLKTNWLSSVHDSRSRVIKNLRTSMVIITFPRRNYESNFNLVSLSTKKEWFSGRTPERETLNTPTL